MLTSKDQKSEAVIFGGDWLNTKHSGSGSLFYYNDLIDEGDDISARAVCSHLNLRGPKRSKED